MVVSMESADLISLRDGLAGHSRLLESLEAEAITLLKRERRVIRDLAGVAIAVIDHYGMGTDDTDQELDLQKKSPGSDLGMELKAGFEDIGNGPREVEKNEGSWIKRAKVKFKAGKNPWIDSEEDEKKRKDVKGKNMEQSMEKDNKMIKKVGESQDLIIGGEIKLEIGWESGNKKMESGNDNSGKIEMIKRRENNNNNKELRYGRKLEF